MKIEKTMFPDILTDILKNSKAFRANANDLKTGWETYVRSLGQEFPELTVKDEGDTVVLGELSRGCTACKNGEWDCLFLTPSCNLACPFCISPFRLKSGIPVSGYGTSLAERMINYNKVGINGISFSGGEPFLCFDKMIKEFESLKNKLPDHYFWLYTNGLLAKREQINRFADSGLNEIRFNTAASGYADAKVLRIMEYAAKKIEHITVEIPLIFNEKAQLIAAIPVYARTGVRFLNLHELMKEKKTLSEQMEGEYFKSFIFDDGHTTEVSMDSRDVFIEVVRNILDSKLSIRLNFCSTMNKLRQIRKRRNHMIRLIIEDYEKQVDEEFLETVFIFKDKDSFRFVHPDLWSARQSEFKDHQAFVLRRPAPLSVFERSGYTHAKEL